jgi:uncharacterized RDD family membrane protein YckC
MDMRTKPHILDRALAVAADSTLILGIAWTYLTYIANPEQLETNGNTIFRGLLIGGWFIFMPLAEGIFGCTLGKKLLGLLVVNLEGRKVSLSAAFIRHLADCVDFLGGGLVGVIVVRATRYHQRIGDILARTRVISKKEAEVWQSILRAHNQAAPADQQAPLPGR